MGVHGLTTYLRENRRTLSKTILLPVANVALGANISKQVTVVVDAWSFIYELYQQSGLPWVYGGQNEEYASAILKTVNAWAAAGIRAVFVFDGPSPPAKFQTTIERINKGRLNASLIFYRTSSAGRSAPGFLLNRDVRMLPPLAHATCILALLNAGVECHFADGEGDAFAVELAGALNAFVAGNDSDFVILRPSGDGYLGYIPLSEMAFTYPATNLQEDEPGDVGFVPIKRSRRKNTTQTRNGLIPEDSFEGVSITVFTPDALAAQLKISVALLPVIAAFVGCDFVSFNKLFFEHKLAPPQRITRVAQVLQPLVNPSAANVRRGRLPSSVPDLVSAMITGLLVRRVESDEQEAMGKTIIDAIVQYNCACFFDEPGSLWPTPDCMLHHPSDCKLLQTLNSAARDAEQKATLRYYLKAYRAEATAKYIGRPLRRFMYAVLNHDVGIVDSDASTPQFQAVDSGLFQTIGTSTESGATFSQRGKHLTKSAIDSLNSSFDHLTASRTSSVSSAPSVLLAVKEYVRRSGHVGAQDVVVPSLSEVMLGFNSHWELDPPDAFHARSRETRLRFFLHALRSDTALVRDLPEDTIMPVAVLRWVIQVMGGRTNPAERWLRREALSFLAASLDSAAAEPAATTESVPAEPRNVQLSAQLLSAYEAAMHLGQTLFLTDIVGGAVLHFSGQRLHTYLAAKTVSTNNPAHISKLSLCSDAALQGLADLLGGEKVVSRREKRQKQQVQQPRPVLQTAQSKLNSGAKSTVPRGGMFSALLGLEDLS
ncbi:PIN domain-like protein [Auriculariales sp. MPI-PUGE-AT-0066]|nr:PIN domain-like protein [Auriculariales sp. MPI-PUGE-AT-0066]